MSKERDKVREKIIEILSQPLEAQWTGDAQDAIEQGIKNQADQILSIPELAVVDRNAELPTPPALDVSNIGTIKDPEYQAWEQYLKEYKQAQQDTFKNKWVKEVD